MNTDHAKRVGSGSSFAKAATLLLGASMLLTSFAPYLAYADDAAAPSDDSSSVSAPAGSSSTDSSSSASTDTTSTTPANGQPSDPASAAAPNTDTSTIQDSTVLPDPTQTPTAAQTQSADPTTGTKTSTDTSVTPPAAHPEADADVVSPGSSTVPASLAPLGDKQLVPTVDPVSGALNYTYPLDLPKGRNGMTPTVNLLYTSQNLTDVSEFGYGWSASIPYIQREDTHGTDQLYTGSFQNFTSSSSGELVEASSAGTSNPDEGTYTAKTQNGDFDTYVYSADTWTVTDKDGTVYTYGATADERQDDPSNSADIYKWMLTKEQDTNGNYIQYTYYKDEGQIYPAAISYTGNGSTAGIYSVTFDRAASSGIPTSNLPGFGVTTAYRISDINIEVSGSEARQYVFTYGTGENGARTLLSSIADVDTATATALTTTLSYTTNRTTAPSSLGFATTTPVDSNIQLFGCDIGTSASMQCGGRFADINGDGLPDYVAAAGDFNSGGTGLYNYAQRIKVYFNTGTGFVDSGWTLPTRTVPETLSSGSPTPQVTFYDDFYSLTSSDGPNSLQLVDVNDDGKADLVWQDPQTSFYSNDPTCSDPQPWKVYLNTGSGWAYSSTWSNAPAALGCGAGLNLNTAQFVDVNHDGYPDIYVGVNNPYYGGLHQEVYFNDHNGHWILNTAWNVDDAGATIEWPAVFENYTTGDSAFTHFVDMNNDGLPDLVVSLRSNRKGDGTYVPNTLPASYADLGEWYYVFMNTGTGWKYDSSASQLPVNDINFAPESAQLSYPTTHESHVVFEAADPYNLSPYLPQAYINNMFDFDGDGWPDVLDYTGAYVSQNNNSWDADTAFTTAWTAHDQPVLEQQGDYFEGASSTPILDLNGDGEMDYFDGNDTSEHLNAAVIPDLLSTITLPSGGTIAATYKSSAQYVDGSGNLLNPNLPVTMQTVHTLTTTDPVLGVSGTTTYQYAGGSYDTSDAFDHKFAGFQTVTTTDALGNVTKTYYHTGVGTDTGHGEYADSAAKIGQIYRVENYDASGNLYKVTINKWDSTPTTGGGTFVYLDQTVTETYDGGTTHKDTAQSYTYDPSTGNLLTKTDWGQVTGTDSGTFTDSGSDAITDTYGYATPVSGSVIRDAVSTDTRTNTTSGATIGATHTSYDVLPYGDVSLGNLTQTASLVGGSVYDSVQKTYDSTGFLTSTTDADSNTTHYAPDAYELYPGTMTNALGQVTYYTYDYRTGKLASVKDPNGGITSTTYDGFGRVTSVTIPDPSTGSPVPKQNFTYVDTSGAVSVHERDNMDSSTGTDIYQYYDGLDRLIQTRKSNASSSYDVSDQSYDALGHTAQTSLPYNGTGTARTAATTTPALYTTYTYDPMGRVTASTNAAGTTTTAYSLWTVTVTDPMSKTKVYIYDAYGDLIAVQEITSGGAYTTQYTYDLNKDLISMRDALGNIRNFSYDDLGQRLSAQDLHATSDTTYGTWQYTYDAAGNLIHTVSPDAKTVNYGYDVLNRVLSEDYTGTAGVESAYTYDSCPDGLGHLCKVVTPTNQTAYRYNILANVIQETDTVASTAYTTTTTYDRQAQPTQITYPDASAVMYTYGSVGEPIAIDRKEATGSWTSVVNAMSYSPLGQLASEKFGNNVTTTNTYDPSQLYFLVHKQTQSSGGGPNLQNITYSYDPAGDIVHVSDTSATDDAKSVSYHYDDLYRLTSATAGGVATGPAYSETYTYNAIGDLLTKNGVPYTYNGSTGTNYANPHAPTQVGSAAYTYDNDGNTLTYGPTTNTWNYKDQMLTTSGPGIASSYTYDYQGNRVSNTASGLTTYYPNKYYTITSGGKVDKQIYDGDTLVATIESPAVGATPTPYYVHVDTVLGSNVISNSAGTKAQLLDYYPFGDIRVNETTGALNEDHKYAGGIYDASTSLNYLGARYYNAKTGQFLSEDPSFLAIGNPGQVQVLTGMKLEEVLMDPQSLNSYSYAENNPITKMDPNGDWWKELLTGKESFSSFEGEVGEATQYMGSGWQNAMNHPVGVGMAVGGLSAAAAVGGAAALTGLSVEYLGGAGTACMALCNENGQKLVDQGVPNLQQLDNVSTSVGKIVSRGDDVGIKGINNFITQVQNTGTAYLDNKTGNINIFAQRADDSGFLRVTLDPDMNRVISAGLNQARNVINGIAGGRFMELPTNN